MTNIFIFRTPDNKIIQLSKLTFQEKTNLLLSDPHKRIIRTLDSIHNLAYVMSDGRVLHEATPHKYAHLFDNVEDYKSFIKGENFYDSVVLYNNNQAYASFGIKPSKFNTVLKDKYHTNAEYSDKEGYKTYFSENGNICFVNAASKTKRGFWFENKASFDYYFYSVFGNTPSMVFS